MFIVTATLDSIAFRNKFIKSLEDAKNTPSKDNIAFVLLMTQIYLEVFLHYNMRKIIGLEDIRKVEQSRYWEKQETKYINDGKEKGKLSLFIELFIKNSKNKQVNLIKTELLEIFLHFKKIRDQIIHGHDISTSSDSNGRKIHTNLKKILNNTSLKDEINKVNRFGELWNQLLDLIKPELKSLRSIEDFKFQPLIFKTKNS